MITQYPFSLQYAVYFRPSSPVYRLSVPMIFERQDLVNGKVRRSKVGRSHVMADLVRGRNRSSDIAMFQSACPHDFPCEIDPNLEGDLPIVVRAEAIFLAFRQLGYEVFGEETKALDYWLESRAGLSPLRRIEP